MRFGTSPRDGKAQLRIQLTQKLENRRNQKRKNRVYLEAYGLSHSPLYMERRKLMRR